MNNYSDPNLGANLTMDDFDASTSLHHAGQNIDAEESLRLHEERLNVDTERVQAGEGNVSQDILEEKHSVEVPASHVDIERRAVHDEIATCEVFDDEA